MATQVVVFVPGIMGSCLETPEGKEVWPGTLASLVLPYGQMKDLMREDLRVTDVIRSVSVSKQYDGLVEFMQRCGFAESTHPPGLYLCPYDWRKDNALSADVLAAKLKTVVADHSSAVRITLVGHSMGGLVCRHFLESGRFDGRQEWHAIDRLVTLGAPHRGAPLALTAAMGRERRLWLNADQVRMLCSDRRYPSLYQLLPPQGEPFLWDEGRRYSVVDPYDPTVVESLNLVPAQMKAASDFHATLALSRKPKHVQYFFFVGTRQRTITTVMVRGNPGNPGAYLFHGVSKLETDDGGDGTVPSWSGSLTSVQSQGVSGEHGVIYRSRELRLTLGGLLGKPGVLGAPAAKAVEVAVRDRVLGPTEKLHATLSFPLPRSSIDGELRIAPITESGAPTRPFRIKYSGLDAETLSVSVPGPALPGVYRVAFYDGGQETGADELFVQQN